MKAKRALILGQLRMAQDAVRRAHDEASTFRRDGMDASYVAKQTLTAVVYCLGVIGATASEEQLVKALTDTVGEIEAELMRRRTVRPSEN